MKSNIVLQLALSSIKKNKKNHLLSFLIMLIAFTFILSCIFYFNSSDQLNQKIKRQKYGDWVICFEDLSQQSVDYLKQNYGEQYVSNVGIIERLYGNHYIGNVDKSFFELASIEVIEGRLPIKSDEIISKSHDVGEVIQINGKSYNVVGLMNNYNEEWCGPSFDYFTCQLATSRHFIYVNSKLSIHAFLANQQKKYVYNYSLLDGDIIISAVNHSGDYLESQVKSDSFKDIMNYFVVIVSVALLISISYDINEREKTVLLLRCIGMSKKDMKKYIYYEVLILTCIALGISMVISSLIGICLIVYYWSEFHILVGISSLFEVFKYLAFIMIVIIFITYLSLQKINLNVMDSLVRKVQRKKLYKYSKAKYMSIRRLAQRMIKHRGVMVVAIVVFMLIVFMMINNGIKSLSFQNPPNNFLYRYNYNVIDDVLVRNIRDDIISANYYHYVDRYKYNVDNEESYIMAINTYSDSSVYEGELKEGRLPQNKNECLYFRLDDGLDNTHKIGDMISISKNTCKVETYIENGDTFERDVYAPYTQVKVVGICESKFEPEFYLKERFADIYNHYIVVDESLFPQNDILHSTELVTENEMFFELNDNDDRVVYSFVKGYQNREIHFNSRIMILIPLLLICAVFIYAIMDILLNKYEKDIRLMRCLGMTFKQVMKLYVVMAMIMWLFYSLYVFVYLMGIASFVDDMGRYYIVYAIVSLNALCFVWLAYRKTHQKILFYPSDVERYY